MNIVFYVLVGLGAVTLWFCLRRIFVWLGAYVDSTLSDTKKILKSDKRRKSK